MPESESEYRMVEVDYENAFYFHSYRQDEWHIDRNVIDQRLERAYSKGDRLSSKQEPRQGYIPGPPIGSRRPTDDQTRFLANPPVESDGWYQSMGWKGSKILGQGGNGLAGLFKRIDENGTEHSIVIKADINGNGLAREAKIMLILLRIKPRSRHIVNLLKDPNNPDAPIESDDLTSESLKRWDSYITLEACKNGDLHDKIGRCRDNQTPFPEKELWSIFSCLAKAVTVLDRGTEDLSATRINSWPICHFDIKPRNIFIGSNDNDHVDAIIHKLGDYGLAEPMTPKLWGESKKRNCRRMCTRGYFAPEQFSERWDFQDAFESNDIVGNYGTHTNIWWIAAVMWQLVLLTGPPPAKGFIVPAHISIDLHNRGTTYGSRILRPGGYSDTLKHLILQCLCESPGQRPNLGDLHKHILLGREACQDAVGPAKENWPADHAVGSMDFWFRAKPVSPVIISLITEERSPSWSELVIRYEKALKAIQKGTAGELVNWEEVIRESLIQAKDVNLNEEDRVFLKGAMVQIAEESKMPPVLVDNFTIRDVSAPIAEIAQEHAAQGAEGPSSNKRRQVETDEPAEHESLASQRVKRKRSDDLDSDMNAGKRRRMRMSDIMMLNDKGEWDAVGDESQDEEDRGEVQHEGQDEGNRGGVQDKGKVQDEGQDDEDRGEVQDKGWVATEIEDDLSDYVDSE